MPCFEVPFKDGISDVLDVLYIFKLAKFDVLGWDIRILGRGMY